MPCPSARAIWSVLSAAFLSHLLLPHVAAMVVDEMAQVRVPRLDASPRRLTTPVFRRQGFLFDWSGDLSPPTPIAGASVKLFCNVRAASNLACGVSQHSATCSI